MDELWTLACFQDAPSAADNDAAPSTSDVESVSDNGGPQSASVSNGNGVHPAKPVQASMERKLREALQPES